MATCSLTTLIPALCNILIVYVAFAISPIIITIVQEDLSKIAIITAISYMTSIIGYIWLSLFSKLYGLKLALLSSMILNAVASFIAASTTNINLLIVGRAIFGLAIPSLIAQTWMSFACGDNKAIVSQSFYNMSFYIGSIFGISVAGIMSELFESADVWSVVNKIAFAMFLFAIIILIFVHDPAPEHCKFNISTPAWLRKFMIENTKTQRTLSERELSFRVGTEKINIQTFCVFLYCEVILGISEGIFYTAWSVQLNQEYKLSEFQISVAYIGVCILALLSNMFVVPRVKMQHVLLLILSILYVFIACFYSHLMVVIFIMCIIKSTEQIPYSAVRAGEYAELPEKKRYTWMVVPMIFAQIGNITGIFVGNNIRNVSYGFMYGFVAVAYGTVYAIVNFRGMKWK
jgi:MFS family permease